MAQLRAAHGLIEQLPRRTFLALPPSWLSTGVVRDLHGPPPVEEYDDVPKYPQLSPHKTEKETLFSSLTDTVRNLRTVEERLWWLNKPKYFGWYSALMNPSRLNYGTLPAVQFATMTRVAEKGELPSCYARLEETASVAAARLAPLVEKRMLRDKRCEEEGRNVQNDKIPDVEAAFRPQHPESKLYQRDGDVAFAKDFHRLLTGHLGLREAPHLRSSRFDYNSRTEAFWFRDNFRPDNRMIARRKGTRKGQKERNWIPPLGAKLMTEEDVYEKYDRALQITASPLVQARHSLALRAHLSLEAQIKREEKIGDDVEAVEDDLCRSVDKIPRCDYSPKEFFSCKPQLGVNTPGHWSNSRHRHTWLQVVSSKNYAENLSHRTAMTEESPERDDMLLTKGILHSFAVLLPEACHLGAGPFINPEEPLVTQTLIADEDFKRVKLLVYQLNRTRLHLEPEQGFDANNVCWHTPEMELFKEDPETGEQRVDVETLKEICKFYLLEPDRALESEVLTWQDIDSNYNREYFFNDFRMMQARGFRGERPEITAWDRIYRIRHNAWFAHGWRDRPWWLMAQIDFKGREHWHPEFKHYDHGMTKRLPVSMRENKDEHRMRKISPPVPNEDQHNIFWDGNTQYNRIFKQK